jgi:hypothetical protein
VERSDWPGRRGPLRWAIQREKEPGLTIVGRWYAAPLWVVALVTGASPLASIAMALRRYIKFRRASREGLCMKCGYDLRATPDRCPECGYLASE